MQRLLTTREQQEVKYQESLKKTVVLLSRIANLLDSNHFEKWFTSTESRFEWAQSSVFEKIRCDLMYQVKQAFYREDRPSDDLDMLKKLGWLCAQAASEHESKCKLKIFKYEKSFIPKGERFSEDLIYNFLSTTDHNGINKEGHFYVWNAIETLIFYVRARHTLSHETSHSRFEKILSNVTCEYMSTGHPFDLLAHDAHAVRMGKPVTKLVMSKEFCSTWILKKGEDDITSYHDRVIHQLAS